MGTAGYAISPEYGLICDGSERVVEYQTFGPPEDQVSFVSNRTFGKVSMRPGLRSTETILAQINQKIDQLNHKFQGIKKDIVMEIRSTDRDDRSQNQASRVLMSEYGLLQSRGNLRSQAGESHAMSRLAPTAMGRARPAQSRLEVSQISSIPHRLQGQQLRSGSISRLR